MTTSLLSVPTTTPEHLEFCFRRADIDGSGTLDINEVAAALCDLHDDERIRHVLAASSSACVRDATGLGAVEAAAPVAARIFMLLDDTNTGWLWPNEFARGMVTLHKCCKSLRLPAPPEERRRIDALFKKADLDGDRHVDLNEWLFLVHQLALSSHCARYAESPVFCPLLLRHAR